MKNVEKGKIKSPPKKCEQEFKSSARFLSKIKIKKEAGERSFFDF